jgi:putative DNA primase/helicase
MSDYISSILDAMSANGCRPHKSEIIIDDKKHRYVPEGDKKPNGAYCFKFSGDDVIGWYKNYREGITHKYISKKNRNYTAEEKAEFKRRIDVERQDRERKIADLHEKSRKKAEYIWGKSEKGDHPYAERKGIDTTGARVWNSMLVVPARRNKKLVSLQFIKSDGEKKFLKDGDIKGAFGSVGTDISKIYISEGFATAKSIYKVVKPYVSVWAYNAGNIKDVYSALRADYPNSDFVICADNDQWSTRADGTPYNAGMESVKDLKCDYTYPDFEADDERRPTDFNDYEQIFGLDKLKERLQVLFSYGDLARDGGDDFRVVMDDAPPSHLNEVPLHIYEDEYKAQELAEVEEWGDLLICDGKGNPVKTSLKNVILFLTHHDRFKGIFRYNEFNHLISVVKCPPWEDEHKFEVHTLNDIDISQTAASLEAYGITPDRTKTHSAIEVAAQAASFHPARDYFAGLQWDGVKRLDTWLIDFLDAHDDEPEYLAFVGKKWLTAAIKRIFEPGCKFDHVLVMEGEQGAGKSTALKTLSTFGDRVEESYFTDSITIADIQNKDTIQKIQGSVIVELAELAGFNKKDDEEIKRWITLQHDDCRLPYARTNTRFSRQFVLSATTNSYDYLKDPTGNRRYWCVKVGEIDIDGLKSMRKQLWAEAYQCYRNGLYIGLDARERELAKEAQEKRRSIDTWEDNVITAIDGLGFHAITTGFKTNDIMSSMGLALRDQDQRNQRRISQILVALGYHNTVVKRSGKVTRVWRKV